MALDARGLPGVNHIHFLTKRMLRQLFRRTSRDKFCLECSPPGVIDAKRPFQCVEFKLTEVFFSLIALSADLLLFDMTLLDRAWPDPCQLLKLEQVLCKHRLQLFKCFHVLLLAVSKLVTTAPHPRTPRPNRPPRTVHPVHLGQPA